MCHTLINNPTETERLQFTIMNIVEYFHWNVTDIYNSIKEKSKEELIDEVIKMKKLVLSDINNILLKQEVKNVIQR